jgi:hypothetical protein
MTGFMRPPAALLPVLLCAAALPAQAEFQSVLPAAALSRDAGGAFVPGSDSGLGLGLALRARFGDARVQWEWGGELAVAGYATEADSDPILQLTASLARRQALGDSGRFFWLAGVGAGVVGIGGSGAAFPLRLGLGAAIWRDKPVGLELTAFDRLAVFVSEGNPSVDTINGLGVELAVRFGR